MKSRAKTQSQVDTTIAQRLGWQLFVQFLHIDRDRKTGSRKVTQQMRQYQQFEILGSADGERGVPAGRVKQVQAVMTQIDPLQNLLHVVMHRQRLTGRTHAVAGADEQVIFEIGTQLFQAVTDRRLADMQRLRNQRQVALLIH